MARKWTEEEKQAASERMKQRNEAKKLTETRERARVPIGGKRDIINVHDTPEGYVDRWVNDSPREPGRIEKFKQAGYEFVSTANVGTPNVDGTHSEDGVVMRDMGKGTTAYLMRQKREYYEEDQAAKQRKVDELEDSIRRTKTKPGDREDGTYGEVQLGRK